MTIILFLIVLAILILVHELGHFAVAKWAKVAVDEFGLGFPPKLWSRQKGETVYSVNLLPLGGFVKLRGEDGGELTDNQSLGSKSRWAQAAIMVAGVVANLLLAWVLLTSALTLGLPMAVSGAPAGAVINNERLMVTSVRPNSPAQTAGLMPGDQILSFKKGLETLSDPRVEESIDLISKNALPVTVEYRAQNDTQVKSIVITPKLGLIEEGVPAIGLSFERVGNMRLPLHLSIIEGGRYTLRVMILTVVSLKDLIKEAVVGEENLLASLVGPVGLAGLVGDASDLGLAYLLSFMAFISINLAIFNLLPLPALDGGRLLILAVEGIIRRPLPAVFTTWVNLLGFIFLIGLMLVITYGDLVRLF